MTRSARLALAFVLCVLCVVVISAQTLTVTPSSATLRIGQSVTLVSSIAGTSWTSDNTVVATVTNTGVVSARGLGMATITGKWRSQRDTSVITVIASTSTLTVTCPANQSRNSPTGTSIAVTYPTATTTGGTAPITITGNPASGSTFPVGVTTVTVTARSNDGQVKTCTFTVTVVNSSIDPSWVQISPGTSIQTAVTNNVGATTFYIKAGTHLQQRVVPKSGNTFVGEAGAILDGQNLTDYAFYSNNASQTNVTIRGLEIKNYTTPFASAGAIRGENVTNWIVTDNVVHHNVEVGIRAGTGTGWQILRNTTYANGLGGISGYQCDGALIKDNHIYGNNADLSATGSEAGIKVLGAENLSIITNNVHNNGGTGIWSDNNYPTTIIDGNTVNDNTRAGIWHEEGYAAIIRNNITERNGSNTPTPVWLLHAGIQVTNSANVEIHHNTVRDNANGIGVMYTAGYPTTGPFGSHIPTNLNVHDNFVRMRIGKSGLGQNTGDVSIYTALSNNHFENNNYSVTSSTLPWFMWAETNKTWAQWTALGHDDTGTFVVVP